MNTKPILFNTPMVRAILNGRKTVTRRLVKPQPEFRDGESGKPVLMDDGTWQFQLDQYHNIFDYPIKPPYQQGDILYVRETWCKGTEIFDAKTPYFYKASYDDCMIPRWRPSIHMPKEAARIFLRVKDVRVEHLQDITDEQAKSEGVRGFFLGMGESGYAVSAETNTFYDGPVGAFANLWNSTIKAAELDDYGWNANPWVWVIEFERISKEEGEKA